MLGLAELSACRNCPGDNQCGLRAVQPRSFSHQNFTKDESAKVQLTITWCRLFFLVNAWLSCHHSIKLETWLLRNADPWSKKKI